MSFNVDKGFVILLLVLFLGSNQLVSAKDVVSKVAFKPKTLMSTVTLVSLPDKCVTLREGRDCFATVTLEWHIQQKQHVCLYQSDKNKPIQCWENKINAKIKIEFESNKSLNYQLRKVNTETVLAETVVEVSWVHKQTTRKRRWRLF